MINELQEIKICIGGTVNEKNQKKLKYTSVELYYTTDEKYAFKVSSITTGECYYSYVEIGCPNGNIYMDRNLSRRMSVCGVKTFTVKKTSGTYVKISAELHCDEYGPSYNGLAYIVHN